MPVRRAHSTLNLEATKCWRPPAKLIACSGSRLEVASSCASLPVWSVNGNTPNPLDVCWSPGPRVGRRQTFYPPLNGGSTATSSPAASSCLPSTYAAPRALQMSEGPVGLAEWSAVRARTAIPCQCTVRQQLRHAREALLQMLA